MREILPGIWTWSVHDDHKGIDFNGWYVRHGDEAVVVDPPAPDAGVLAAIEELGAPIGVLLTNKDHVRASATLCERFGCGVGIHEADRELATIDVQDTFRDGSELPCGLSAIRIARGKSPGESALLHAPARALIIGDAVIGRPAGSLAMLPAEKLEDPAAAKDALRVLLDHDFDALLLGDGAPIVEGGKAKLAAFLAA